MQKDKDFPLFKLKSTFEIIERLENMENVEVHGYMQIPNSLSFSIVDNIISFSFESVVDFEWFDLLQNYLPETRIIINGLEFVIPEGSAYFDGNLTLGIDNPQKVQFRVNEIIYGHIDSTTCYYWRYLFPIRDGEWMFTIEADKYQDDFGVSSIFSRISFEVNTTPFVILSKKYNGIDYMIIQSNACVSSEEMEKLVSCITTSLGFIIGRSYEDYVYRIASSDDDFKTISRFSLDRLDKSKFCEYKIIETNKFKVKESLKRYPWQEYAYQKHFKDDNDDSYYDGRRVPQYIIGKIADLAYSNNDLFLAITMLIEGSWLSFGLQPSFYHVALEIITSYKKSHNSCRTQVSNDIYLEQVVPPLLSVLDSIPILDSSSKKIFAERIQKNLNNKANSNKLEEPFVKAGYTLTSLDKSAIQKRNSSFHGHLSLSKEFLQRQSNEYMSLSFRLHKLCCILLLKDVGFNGRIINNEVLWGMKDACKAGHDIYVDL